MDNEELVNEKPGKKPSIPGKKSTIVSGVFITLGLIGLIFAYLLNFVEIISNITSQADNAGEAIGAVVAAIVIAAVVIFGVFLSLLVPFCLGIPALVLSIKNIKRENPVIHKLGIAFTVVSAVMLVAVVARLVLLFTKVM